jgi:hypothetical protein
MAGRPATRREEAVAYFLEHPEAKDHDVADVLKMDMATVGRARSKLISEGLLPDKRKRAPKVQSPLIMLDTPARAAATVVKGESLLTDADLRGLEADAGTDEEMRKKILTALRKIAFAPGMNYETAMSAMSLWIKLKDAAAVKELGPGNPLTYADAKERLKPLMLACGFELVFECFKELFVPEEKANEGVVPAQHAEAASGAAGATPAP